jgi:hypothetical protein
MKDEFNETRRIAFYFMFASKSLILFILFYSTHFIKSSLLTLYYSHYFIHTISLTLFRSLYVLHCSSDEDRPSPDIAVELRKRFKVIEGTYR